MAQDWDIKPRGECCLLCEQPFLDRQSYTSSLVYGKDGYVRADYCDACWEERSEDLDPYSVWQGLFLLPPPKEDDPLQKETAETLLRRLMQEEDQSTRNVIYILAVMLERKRILVEKDVQILEDGTMIRLYEHRKTGETFIIPDPRLRLNELEPVQEQVIEMLGGGKQPAPAKDEKPKASPPTANDIDEEAGGDIKAGFYTKG